MISSEMDEMDEMKHGKGGSMKAAGLPGLRQQEDSSFDAFLAIDPSGSFMKKGGGMGQNGMG